MEDMAQLERTISQQLNYYNSLSRTQENKNEYAIYQVPNHIRQSQTNAYEPMVLSIGPFHHDAPVLSQMEKAKWNCLRHILRLNKEKELADYLNAVGSVEQEARRFYRRKISMETHEFLQMLLLDGCFVLVSLYGTNDFAEKKSGEKGKSLKTRKDEKKSSVVDNHAIDYVAKNSVLELEKSLTNRSKYPIDFNAHGLYNCVLHDLLLLENQIPLFVVKKIYGVLSCEEEEKKEPMSFITGIVEYMEKQMLLEFPIWIPESQKPKDFYHLLHLCHMYFKPSKKPQENQSISIPSRFFNLFRKGTKERKPLLHQQPIRWRRAVEYYESGIEFRVKESRKENPHGLLDVTFKNGVMEIPHIPLDETIGQLFRNLIALEQTSSEFGNDFCAYIILMSQLASVSDDVGFISERKIIHHMLESDDEAANLLADLGKDLVFDFKSEYYLKTTLHEMERYYECRRRKWIAWLWHKQFNNPWMGVMKIGGIIVIICTLISTVLPVMAFVRPNEVKLITMN